MTACAPAMRTQVKSLADELEAACKQIAYYEATTKRRAAKNNRDSARAAPTAPREAAGHSSAGKPTTTQAAPPAASFEKRSVSQPQPCVPSSLTEGMAPATSAVTCCMTPAATALRVGNGRSAMAELVESHMLENQRMRAKLFQLTSSPSRQDVVKKASLSLPLPPV